MRKRKRERKKEKEKETNGGPKWYCFHWHSPLVQLWTGPEGKSFSFSGSAPPSDP